MSKGIRHYRSSIPKDAKERVTAQHIKTRRIFKAEYWLRGKLVGVRFFDQLGNLETEHPFKDGLLHGTVYLFEAPGQLKFAEPYANGLAHGTARQWSDDGELLGTYTMRRGTGVDLWRQKKNWGNGRTYLSEARYIKDGKWHGFEWWLNEDQKSVWLERHFQFDRLHGIERDWNAEGRLRRGYPRYWVSGVRVTKRQYLRAVGKDSTLPRYLGADNRPEREFPPEIIRSRSPRRPS